MMEPVRSPRNISARAITQFLEDLSKHDYRLHGLMIWHKGDICYADTAAPYTLQSSHRLFSAAKSILVLAALKAIEQGKLKLTDKVVSFFPEYPMTDKGVQMITFEDLLTMRTGQEGDPFGLLFQDFDADLIGAFLETPTLEEPGTKFRYNNTVPHIICEVVSRAVGMPFPEYMSQHFCEPLNAPMAAPVNPQGIYNPVVTTMSMESFFKYALLFLHGGVTIESVRLVSEELVHAAIAEHTLTGLSGNSSGYGYQIWRNAFGGSRMDGGWGQFAFLLPDTDTCVVLLSDMTECAYAINAFEKILLPAIRGNGVAGPQPEVRLASLAPSGSCCPDPDILGCEYAFHDGTVLTLFDDHERVTVRLDGQNPRTVEIGLNGQFLPTTRYFTRATVSIDQMVYGQDNGQMLLSGAWSTSRCLNITGKCFGEMGEYAIRLLFEDEKVVVFYNEIAQHGIADPLTGTRIEGVKQCKAKSC